MRLRTRFFLFVQGTTVVGIVLVSWTIYRSARSELEATARCRLRQNACLVAEQAEYALSHIICEVEGWAKMPLTVETAQHYRERASIEAFHEYFRGLEARFSLYQSINLVNLDADCVASSSADTNRLYHADHRHRVAGRFDFREALAGRTGISESLVSRATGRPCLAISVPVRRTDNGVCAALRVVVDLGLFNDALTASLKHMDDRQVVVMDPALNIQLAPRPLLVGEPLSRQPYRPPEIVLPKEQEAADEGTFLYRDSGEACLAAFCRVSRPRWVIVVRQPLSEVLAPIATVRRSTLGVSVALALLLVPMMSLMARPALNDLAACQKFARNVRDGQPNPPLHIRSGGELTVLAACLADMEAGLRQHQATRERMREAERLLAEARWRTLRYQVNPHFLFNALNSVDALLGTSPEGARRMLQLLAEFYRATLLVPPDGMTTVREEMGRVGRYLAIEQIRWGEQALRIEMSAEPEWDDFRLPAFTLQPLVENAVKYGQLSEADPLEIRLAVRRRESAVEIVVANRGRWFGTGECPADVSAGVGLDNVLQRLRNAFGESIQLTHEASGGWVRVVLRLPEGTRES
ncbi:MAG: histidine kinase [Kiritimatiellae bacterium]|nr:histidine kinase [Kiritimatiellia bacterium]